MSENQEEWSTIEVDGVEKQEAVQFEVEGQEANEEPVQAVVEEDTQEVQEAAQANSDLDRIDYIICDNLADNDGFGTYGVFGTRFAANWNHCRQKLYSQTKT